MPTMNVSVVSPGVKKVSWNFNEKNTVTIEFCNELSKIMTELEQDKSTLAVILKETVTFFQWFRTEFVSWVNHGGSRFRY